MIDSHGHPESFDSWGFRPVLFEIGGVDIPSYSFFVLLGLLVGLLVFYFYARKQKKLGEKSFYIIFAGLIGGVLGAKLPIWIINFPEIVENFPDIYYFLSGRTIVGGLIGGTGTIWLVKWFFGIKRRIGNAIAPALAVGIGIGRLGCFFRGCCYGTETKLPWGVDFGDGLLRHPTQLYESIFCFILFLILHFLLQSKYKFRDGILFRYFMITYFTFRFFVEFIRVEPVVFLGMTGFQLASLLIVGVFTFQIFYYSIKLSYGQKCPPSPNKR
jgi:phosphatidylglycerol---prolipoprotein diacylglyceryl transferase